MADVFIEDGPSYTKVGKKTLVHVVVGDIDTKPKQVGEILDTYFCRNGENHLLDVKWVIQEGVRKFVEEIRIKPYYRKRGWMTLQDAYLAEDNAAGFKEYLEFSEQQRKDPVGMRKVKFPVSKLPESVQKLIASRGADKPGTEKWKLAEESEAKPTAKKTAAKAGNGKA